MTIPRYTLDACHEITGTAVVIDVLRAFSTAAYAFRAGVAEIILTDTVENAFALRSRFPEALLLGEVNGYPIPGFDFSNSPVGLSRKELSGRMLIQRTTAGTQGVVRSAAARKIFVASFCCAAATAQALGQGSIASLAFVITGGEEDALCADYLERLISGETPDWPDYEQRVRASKYGQRFIEDDLGAFSARDLEACLQLDVVPFSMQVAREEDLLLLRPLA